MQDSRITKTRGRPAMAPVQALKTADVLKKDSQSASTEAAYACGLRHYEEHYGGRLPATVADIENYLETYQATHATTTLRQRIWAISRYHREQGHNDPTLAPGISEMLAGIHKNYGKAPRKARPLLRTELIKVVAHLENEITAGQEPTKKYAAPSRPLRDRALLLIGFWLGMRSDELARLSLDQITLEHTNEGRRLKIALAHTKTSNESESREWYLPELPILCPVHAYMDWIGHAMLDGGPLFRKIDLHDNIREDRLNTGSVTGIIRRALTRAGLEGNKFSSHSLRRGLATCWYEANGSVEALTHWVQWKSVQTAINYQQQTRALPKEMLQAWAENQSPAGNTPGKLEQFLAILDAKLDQSDT